MKITQIQGDNFAGLQSIDVKLRTAVALFCGENGSGKSSIENMVRIAITQDHVRDVTVKKDFGKLVHRGSTAGGALVVVDDDNDASFSFNMPKGEFKGPEISEPMRVALHGQKFASMTQDQRRTFLFDLTKCKPNAANVKTRALSKTWACDEALIDAVLPMLRTGFPSACNYAKDKARESKGAWHILAGETYGAVKADTWEAPVPDLPAGDREELAQKVAALDKNILVMTESLGGIKQAASAAAASASKRAALADGAGKVDGLRAQLENARAELATYEPTVTDMRTRAAGKARVGLVHDMAAHLLDITDMAEVSNGQKLLARYIAEYGEIGGAVDTEAQIALPDHEKGLLVLQNRVKNLQRDLDSAVQIKGQFDALAPAETVEDAAAEIDEVEQLIATAKASRQKAENHRLDIVAAQKHRDEAAAKTAEAMACHKSIAAWLAVAAALAPDGIQAEILADALAPVNAGLQQAAADTDWMQATIAADMSITADGLDYQVLSESEQWRVDAMIAQVVSLISGIKILMLDRCDVLDVPGRSQLFGWIDMLAREGEIDTALLFATLKEPPTGMLDTIAVHWVQDGLIAEPRKLAAA